MLSGMHDRRNEMKNAIEIRREVKLARLLWGNVNKYLEENLFVLLKSHRLSVKRGDLLLLNGSWYITHSGLLRLACRKHCRGIRVQPVREFWDGGLSRFAFRAKVYTSEICKGRSEEHTSELQSHLNLV